jgi:hypothetical protein
MMLFPMLAIQLFNDPIPRRVTNLRDNVKQPHETETSDRSVRNNRCLALKTHNRQNRRLG